MIAKKRVQKNLCTAFTEVKQKEVYRKKKTGTVSRRWDTFLRKKEVGAGDEARTRYLHLGKVALYRMSYARITESIGIPWCPRSESNQRHADFQSAALPTELQGHNKAVDAFWWEQQGSNL